MNATTFTGALSGNASSATQLQTARTIGGVSFNGTANINLPASILQETKIHGNAATATQVDLQMMIQIIHMPWYSHLLVDQELIEI